MVAHEVHGHVPLELEPQVLVPTNSIVSFQRYSMIDPTSSPGSANDFTFTLTPPVFTTVRS